jgi:hypothetical protein
MVRSVFSGKGMHRIIFILIYNSLSVIDLLNSEISERNVPILMFLERVFLLNLLLCHDARTFFRSNRHGGNRENRRENFQEDRL